MERKARLNPFLFPPDTNFRFLLLLVSVLGSSLFAYYTLHNQFHGRELVLGWQQCFSKAESVYPLEGLEIGTQEYTNQNFLYTQYNNTCIEPLEQSQAQWILRWLVLLLLAAGILYWYMPLWRIRRDKLTIFSVEDDMKIFDYLLQLCREAGLSKPPTFLLRALNPSPSGLAFGRLGRYYVVLNGGLIPLFYQNQTRFRVIVLHELSHIRNQDIDKTYFSLALVLSFLLVTLIPLFLGNIASLFRDFFGNISFVVWQLFGAILYIPLIYITLASILRSREIYADARVLLSNEQNVSLRNELISLSPPKNKLLSGVLGLHPEPAWRLKVFDEPHLLFGSNLWDAFLAGFISAFALGELDNFLSILFPPRLENFALYGASLLFVPFIVYVVGLGVWQKVFANQVLHQKSSGFGRYGLSLGLGMLMGTSLSFSAFIENSVVYGSSSIVTAVIAEILFGLLFLVGVFLFFRWVAVGATVWLETVSDPINLRRVTSFGLLVTGLVMSLWIGGYYLLRKFGYEVVLILALPLLPIPTRVPGFESFGLSLLTESILAYFIRVPSVVTSPVLISLILWIFPLLSRVRKSRNHVENIFMSDQTIQSLPATTQPQLRPLLAFLAGFVVGIVFTVISVFIRIWIHLQNTPDVLAAPQSTLNYRAVQVSLAIVVQILLAMIVSLFSKKLGWAHGLLAAFAAGLFIAVGSVFLTELADCISILRIGQLYSCSNFLESDLFFWIGSVTVLGTLFSLLPAFVMSWVGSSIRSLTAKTFPS